MKQTKDLNPQQLLQSQEEVMQHAPLVHRTARYLLPRLPREIAWDDLIQAGMIGLLEAFRNFDATKACSFETFASIRIRGAMLDEVRRCNWLPRSYHRTSRKIRKAITRIEHRTKKHAKDPEIAAELNISLTHYYHLLNQMSTGQMLGFQEMDLDEEKIDQGLSQRVPEPYEALAYQVFKQNLVENIRLLPEKEYSVLALYYDKELNLKEISQILEVTESRICQIHNQAVLRLQARMRDWQES
ncbi:MAG: RNA polymerase sigma factor FliA [Gammaproteobacteria bacterium]|nr:RNA polymerase sigma factor FliA [Gammaproteobacteria bacterium]